MDRPTEAKYTKSHEWVKVEGDLGIVGLSDYAVEHLSDLVYVELPAVGTQATQGEAFGEIESVKAVVDLNAPVSGEIVEINETLPDQLELLSDDTFGAGWMAKVKMSDAGELDNLMDLDAYNKFCETEEAQASNHGLNTGGGFFVEPPSFQS